MLSRPRLGQRGCSDRDMGSGRPPNRFFFIEVIILSLTNPAFAPLTNPQLRLRDIFSHQYSFHGYVGEAPTSSTDRGIPLFSGSSDVALGCRQSNTSPSAFRKPAAVPLA